MIYLAGFNILIQRVFTFSRIFWPFLFIIAASLSNSTWRFGEWAKYACMTVSILSTQDIMCNFDRTFMARLTRWARQ
jgi:hypothetical protein